MKASKQQAGVSLIEMLISLAILSIIVFPLISIPLKASQSTKTLKDSDLLTLEVDHLTQTLNKEISLSYQFFPLHDLYTDNYITSRLDPRKAVFFAYVDSLGHYTATNTSFPKALERRVGYRLAELMQNNNSPYQPRRWTVLRTIVDPNNGITAYDTDDRRTWTSVGQISGENGLYITAPNGTTPSFIYCIGARCDGSVDADEADSLTIMSSGLSAVTYHYNNAALTPPQSLHFKLASRQAEKDPKLAEQVIAPFSYAMEEFSPFDHWVAEKQYTAPSFPAFRKPITSGTEVSSATFLDLKDFEYNYKTGEIVTATNSPDINSVNTETRLYLFKMHAGLPDYQSYQDTDTGYANFFPKVFLRSWDGWPPSATNQAVATNVPEYRSTAIDNEGNIYVMSYSNDPPARAAYLNKFNAQGRYISRMQIPIVDIPGFPRSSHQLFVTFNPNFPDEIVVFMNPVNDGNPYLRTYPKDQNYSLTVMSHNAQTSLPLNDPTVSNLPDGTVLNWRNVRGMTYDPLHNRYLFVFSSGTPNHYAQILSMDIDLSPNGSGDGSPAQRAVYIKRLYRKNSTVPISNPTGIAYDPQSNQVFVSAGSTYYRILPNTRLNAVFTQ